MSLILNGDTGVQGNSGAFVAGTAVASTSGTSIDFTSIPSWVKRITVMLTGVSTNGTSNEIVQLGSGSATTTGYVGVLSVFNGAALGASTFSSGFTLDLTTAATDVRNACLVFTLLGSNTWVCIGTTSQPSNTRSSFLNGYVPLSGALDRVRITTVNGTDTFDAGSINILYE